MAIIATVVDERGAIYNDQYIRVDELKLEKTKMQIYAGIYFNEDTAKNLNPPHRVEIFDGIFQLESEQNPWAQAYTTIKQRWPNHQDV